MNVIELWPGDKVMVRLNDPPSIEERKRLQSELKQFFGLDVLVVLVDGVTLDIVRGATGAEGGAK